MQSLQNHSPFLISGVSYVDALFFLVSCVPSLLLLLLLAPVLQAAAAATRSFPLSISLFSRHLHSEALLVFRTNERLFSHPLFLWRSSGESKVLCATAFEWRKVEGIIPFIT